MSDRQAPIPQPPEPPQVARRFKLYPYQWFTIPLLMLIPMLALFGVLGEHHSQVVQSSNSLELKVNYATQLRTKLMNPLTISVRNIGNDPLSRVTVSVEREYTGSFGQVRFTPNVTQIDDKWEQVTFENVPAGETRVVSIDLQGEHPGKHSGIIQASTDVGSVVQVSVETFVLP